MTPTEHSCRDENSPDMGFSVGELLTQITEFSQPIVCCETCRDPTQKDIELLGVKKRVPVLCRCRTEAYAREKAEAEQRDLRRRLEKFKAYSLMDNRYEASTFKNWEHRPDNRDDYALGTKYCEMWADMYANNRGLMFHGRAGNGKTFLSFAIANAVDKQGKAVMAISISKLLAIIKDSFDKNGELGEIDVLNTVRDACLLVLDDLGVEYKTAWAYEKLYAIIDTRYRTAKPTIITTNYSLDALRENLATIDLRTRITDPSERIFSRITEMCAFHEIKGASWRISKGTRNKAAMFAELGLTQKP
ncbi:MAG: ATP-binding protein [Defluviitaleaceae bacterium]|nr:ATP-binding protein [Defluviitaleaceae bacterium]